MRMFFVPAALALLALPCSALAQDSAARCENTPIAEEAGTNGRNVTAVVAGPSRFGLLPYRRWVEGTTDGVFEFEELYRDDWSVYLFDRSRSVRLQIDLHRRQVFYADNEDAPELRLLYSVESANNEANGLNIARVSVPSGVFLMTGPGSWIERGFDGSVFNFLEQSRDDGSVYLLDRSRNVRLQMDVRRKQILYADDSAPLMRPLYDIISCDAVM